MNKKLLIPLCILIAVIIVVLTVLITVAVMSSNVDSPAAPSGEQTIYPTIPYQGQNPGTAQPTSTVQPTSDYPHQTQTQTSSRDGSDIITGTWAGSKSILFGLASANFQVTARPDGTMTISGTADAPSAGVTNQAFSLNADWIYSGGTKYVGYAQGKQIEFTCDGKTMSVKANPYTLGLIDNPIGNIDLDIELRRV